MSGEPEVEPDPTFWERLLPRFSLGRPITVLVVLATVLVVGLLAAVGIPLETFPQGFSLPFLVVSVPWADAPPQEVVDKILLPLEQELSTVRGLDHMSSRAFTGNARVYLSFKAGTDMDVAYREVRDRIQRARAQLPEDADRQFIFKQDLSAVPVVMIGVGVDPQVTDPYNLIQNQIILPLRRIDGVASVNADGLEEKEILIELDRERTAASGLNIYQLAQELSGDNFTMASGNVLAGGSKLLLRSVARYPDLAALENRVLSTSVRLKDIAQVRYDEPEKTYVARVDGRPAIAVQVLKEGQANTLEVCRRVMAKVAEMQVDPRLTGLQIQPFFNQGDLITNALETLLNSGKLGALFAVVVLFYFLRRLRMTLIITLAIPLSMLMALAVMYFAGETLNILTLLGLMISIGLLVDNAVVVAENIYRHHDLGLSPREACIRGAGEIALAITMATLTTIAVFLPVSLVEGTAQFFLLRLSLPISVSLAASLLVALVFVPLSVYLTLPRKGARAEGWTKRLHRRLDGVLQAGYDLIMVPVGRLYHNSLRLSLHHRMDLLVVVTVVAGLTFGLAFKDIDFSTRQDDERGGFEVSVELPRNSTLDDAKQYFLAAEQVVAQHREDWDLEGFFIFHRATNGEIQGWLHSPRRNELTPREITEQVVAALPERAGVKVYTSEESQVDEAEAKSVHTFVLYGEDPVALEHLGRQLEDLFRGVDGVLGVKKGSDQEPSGLALVVDRDRAQRQGINPQAVAGVVAYALRGQSLPKYYRDGREIPVRVRFKEENRESLAELKDFAVPTDAGSTVALSAVTDVELLASPQVILRRDKQVARTITLELEQGREDATRTRLRRLASTLDLPEGVSFGSGATATSNEDAKALGLALGLSIVFIYLLMAFLFESFVLPLSILVTIPLAGIGVGWAHALSGRNLDFLGVVGVIVLTGVVVNNGIVLIDYVNRLRREGIERTEAILLAAERRFRPILMTALTTICGALPLVFGGGTQIGLSYTSFGLTLVGGMTTATLLTLLVVPVSYTLFDDARRIVSEKLGRVLGRGGRSVAATAEPVATGE